MKSFGKSVSNLRYHSGLAKIKIIVKPKHFKKGGKLAVDF
jgi:hypothetical protein